MNFPSRLRGLRKTHKLTQEQLGKKINVSKVSISGYESGKRTPDLDTLLRIANEFSVSIDYILCRSANDSLRPVMVMESKDEYMAYFGRKVEKLTKEEAIRLEEELEMFRLLKEKKRTSKNKAQQ